MTTPSTGWHETIPDGEEALLVSYAEAIRGVQRKHAAGGGASRALHAKANAGVEAQFEVLGDLPGHARAGLFARPGTYRCYVRFSNGSGARQRDARGDVRGVAVKVVGVPGKKVITGMEDALTQDFLFVRTPTIPFRDAREFAAVVTAAANPALLLPRVVARLGIRRAFQLLPAIAKGFKAPISSLATTRYFTAAPIRYGAYAVKCALEPQARPDPSTQPSGSPDALGDELARRLRGGPVVYDFRVQFYVDEASTPIEDPTVEWSEAAAPFVTVARLTLLAQDVSSERGRKIARAIESFSFDPWHALEAHRPLGGIMRARNHAYRLSTAERAAAPEPDGTESFDV